MASSWSSSAQRGVAMVFQSYALYPHMNVAANMGFSLRMSGVPASERDARVRKAAAILQLDALLDRLPKELSGGQRQRVAIGRAIVREPGVFLFDEPLSNLDAELRVQMRLELTKLHRQLGTTMVFVTHDQVEAMTLADRIVAGFIGSPKMNFLSGRILSVAGDRLAVEVPGLRSPVDLTGGSGRSVGEEITIGIRPEH